MEPKPITLDDFAKRVLNPAMVGQMVEDLTRPLPDWLGPLPEPTLRERFNERIQRIRDAWAVLRGRAFADYD